MKLVAVRSKALPLFFDHFGPLGQIRGLNPSLLQFGSSSKFTQHSSTFAVIVAKVRLFGAIVRDCALNCLVRVRLSLSFPKRSEFRLG